jgi:hypothetical protein
MQDWVVAVISGASAIGGGVVVGVSNYAINRVQARDARNLELRTATVGFLQAVDMVTHQLRSERKPGRIVAGFFRGLERSAPTFDANLARLQQRILTPHIQPMIEFFVAASNRLLLVAPSGMLEPMGEMMELLSRAEERDAEWDQHWDEAHDKLVVIARRLLGHKAGGGRVAAPAPTTERTAPITNV